MCNSNLPHTRSATGRGRAEHSGGDEEVASVFRSEKKLLGGKGGGGGGRVGGGGRRAGLRGRGVVEVSG